MRLKVQLSIELKQPLLADKNHPKIITKQVNKGYNHAEPTM